MYVITMHNVGLELRSRATHSMVGDRYGLGGLARGGPGPLVRPFEKVTCDACRPFGYL